MSFGAGHIQDMNNRIKQNRALKPSNRSKFKGNNREAVYSKTGDAVKKPNFKQIPEEELDIIKAQIREKAKKQRRREKIILIASIGLALSAFLVFYFYQF